MCILFIYRKPCASIGNYKLIVASNRDEIFKRPALPAFYWKNHPDCLGGIDMESGKEGGTWLAMSMKGRAGITLNLSNEPRFTETPPKGRGSLITNYITSNDCPKSYLSRLHEENQNGQPYNPYNLILIDLIKADVYYLSSSTKSTGPKACKDSILGFSNSEMESPYKKVEAGKEKLKEIVDNASVQKQDDLIRDLLSLLKSKEKNLPDPELKRRSTEYYEELSSINVSIGDYCTRTHSVLLVDAENKLTFVEENLMPDLSWKRQTFVNSLTQ